MKHISDRMGESKVKKYEDFPPFFLGVKAIIFFIPWSKGAVDI